MTRRLFVALNFDDAVKKEFADAAEFFRLVSVRGNFVREENFHLTLKFLGGTGDTAIPAIRDELRKVGGESGKFLLSAGKPGFFDRGGEMILWIGLEGDLTELKKLWTRVETAMARCGFENDPRGYAPHVTLARKAVLLKPFAATAEKLKINIPPIKAASFSLMESSVKNGVLTYTPLEVFHLS